MTIGDSVIYVEPIQVKFFKKVDFYIEKSYESKAENNKKKFRWWWWRCTNSSEILLKRKLIFYYKIEKSWEKKKGDKHWGFSYICWGSKRTNSSEILLKSWFLL